MLASLKAGRYYSTQEPSASYSWTARLQVETSGVYAFALTGGGGRWQSAEERRSGDGEPIAEADFGLTPFRSSYCRVTLVDPQGKRAWSNPIWP